VKGSVTMIYNLNNLDLLGKCNDGSVELYIISTGGLDDSPETQSALLDKIQNYLGYISSNEFKKEFGKLPAEKIHIIFQADEPLSPLYTELFAKIVPWVGANGALITLKMA